MRQWDKRWEKNGRLDAMSFSCATLCARGNVLPWACITLSR
jgi:hypothetical protein